MRLMTEPPTISEPEPCFPSAADVIRDNRKVALAILKPSGRDLEVGLALHRESLVAESYSLGLQASIDGAAIQKEIDAGASALEIKDLVEEQRVSNWLVTPESRALYRQAWKASGVSCLFHNCGEEGNDPQRLLKRLARHTHLIDAMPEFTARATTPEQIAQNHRAGKRSICFSLNGVPLLGRNINVQEEMSAIRTFAQLGAKIMHLTYNRRNPIGDGCGEKRDGGLSDFGHAVVAELNRLNVIIDLAHTGWQTCLDTARASCQPVLVSHSAVHALNAHIRNKPDEVIRAVLDTGGTMGITNVPPFLGGRGDISAFLDHIDYMVAKFGADSLTIGTDHSYRLPGGDAWGAEISSRPRQRKSWEQLWPDTHAALRAEWQTPEMTRSLCWTNWPLFTVGMVQRGHPEETIRKILGGNLMRVVKAVWEAQ